MYMNTRANLEYWSTDNCCLKWSLRTGTITIGTLSLVWQALMVMSGVMMVVKCPVITNITTTEVTTTDFTTTNLTFDLLGGTGEGHGSASEIEGGVREVQGLARDPANSYEVRRGCDSRLSATRISERNIRHGTSDSDKGQGHSVSKSIRSATGNSETSNGNQLIIRSEINDNDVSNGTEEISRNGARNSEINTSDTSNSDNRNGSIGSEGGDEEMTSSATNTTAEYNENDTNSSEIPSNSDQMNGTNNTEFYDEEMTSSDTNSTDVDEIETNSSEIIRTNTSRSDERSETRGTEVSPEVIIIRDSSDVSEPSDILNGTIDDEYGGNNTNNFSCPWLPGPEMEVLGVYTKDKLLLVAGIFISYSGVYFILSLCVVVGSFVKSVTLLQGWVAFTGFHNLVILASLLVPLPFTTLLHLVLSICYFILSLYTWAVVKSYMYALKVEMNKPLLPEGSITDYTVDGVDVSEVPVQV